MNELIAVSTGLFAGTITGIVPGAGVMVAMIVATPLLMHFDIIQLLLFYMSLASMVQFTGTIPAVYLGVPGETNSLPAVIELSLIHISEPTRQEAISYAVFC